MARRWLAIAAGIPAALLLFAIFIIIFTPAATLKGIVDRALKGAGYTFRAAEFGKALPLGVKARNLELADERGVLFRADDAVVRLRLLPLLAGKVSISYRAGVGKGYVRGVFSPLPGGEVQVEISHLRLEDIPFFLTATGTRVKGDLRGEGNFRGSGNSVRGEAKLEVKGADLAGVKIGGLSLPDASYDTVRGALKVGNGKAVLESATLQGEGLYVRLKGDLSVTTPLGDAPLNLTLELMPKPDFLERQKFVFLLLTKYLISPGNYRIPIQGVLAKPTIQ
ncbi:MAG TPA: type II secretion system protein GspN [Geobacteraceae bacterium]|nr:type II secretion system protein GspN [Geobacteraceae bacterium]